MIINFDLSTLNHFKIYIYIQDDAKRQMVSIAPKRTKLNLLNVREVILRANNSKICLEPLEKCINELKTDVDTLSRTVKEMC